MLKFILLVNWFAVSAFGQNVTSSFDSSMIGENPASAATRVFGIVTPFASMTKTEQSLKDPFDTTKELEWTREINVQKYEFIFAGKGTTYVPEIYVSQNRGKVEVFAGDNSNESENEIDLLSNQLNLGINLSTSLKLGFIFFYPQLKYDSSGTYINGVDIRRNNGSADDSVMGVGVGMTTFLTQHFAVGALFTGIFQKSEYSGSTRVNLDAAVPYKESSDSTHLKYGVGISYQYGNSKTGGIRIEVSHIRMKWGDDQQSVETTEKSAFRDSQSQAVVEVSTLGFVGGLSATMTDGRYINYRNFLESVVEESGQLPKPVITYSGFLGFKTTGGSSLSGFITYYEGKSDVSFLGTDTTAQVTKYGVGVSYAYSF